MAKKYSPTFLGPQLGLSIIGTHAYAYSGNVTDPSSSSPDTTMLDFYSPASQYIKGKFQFEANNESSLVVDIVIEFNGQRIYDSEFDASPSRGMWLTPLRVIIPPNTHVVMKFGSSGSMEAASQFTGRVYDV